ncbi:Ig-like domain-containing protein [Pontibacter liquoris]|uniref:Ig-like domain-containing protein n=1 Tax=Pontibacter liquoris TaxID=2905677 RepID=UPI001FA6BACB|nr:Ig-like domain-containing protein [Pontibacter liquoris]
MSCALPAFSQSASQAAPAAPVTKARKNLANKPFVVGRPGNELRFVAAASQSMQPYVSAVRPENGATDVPIDKSISVDLEFPNGNGLDGNTVTIQTVRLYEIKGALRMQVAGTAVNATAAGDAITLSAPLALSTTYEFEITDQVKDLEGYPILPFTSRFTTTNTSSVTLAGLDGVAFTPQTLISASPDNDGFTSLAIGPDHRLYATTSGGKIERWDIQPDGTLLNQVTIAPFGDTKQLLIGFHFDPYATATNLQAWIAYSSGEFMRAPDWSSRIAKINLTDPVKPETKVYVTNLPRSYKDHSINSIDFGPDGALYVMMGSNTAMGESNKVWGNRPERLLSAAVLRLDIVKADKKPLPIDAMTRDGGGTYNPYASDAPLTLFATGIRNAYDLVWHSNGQLYVPTNGSAAGGNTPALKSGTIWSDGKPYTGPDIPALTNVRATQCDFLYSVVKGGYYGHPNALRNEYILNGGNPTDGKDPGEIVWTASGNSYGYPVGTPKEPNFRGWAYNFGPNISPNGAIEYKSNAFGGKLQGRLLVCRFSGGDDLIVLEPGPTGLEIVSAVDGIQVPGFRRPYANPLDVTEDELTGNLYISEYFDMNGKGKPQITLLKANEPARPEVPGGDSTVDMIVYPNPVTRREMFILLHKLQPKEEVNVTLLDIDGRLVTSHTELSDEQGSLKMQIALDPKLHGGLYIIKLQAASGKTEFKRVIIQ